MNADQLLPGCFPCDQQAASSLPPREDVVHTDHWRVAHAFNSTLPGWLVLLPKTYLMQFSEAEGFSHLHLHLVPRLADQPEDRRGPRVFGYLAEDQAEWPPENERDDVALSLRAALT